MYVSIVGRKETMAKGANAKVVVENKIKEAFGNDFIGIADKKIYVWADDGGERVQIAISMTCPKTGIAGGDPITPKDEDPGDWNFEDAPTGKAEATAFKPAEVSDEEISRINDLMSRLGI
jgi:hypothetical protein